MINEVGVWLKQKSDDLVVATMYRAHNMLPGKDDITNIISILAENIGASRETQLSALQYWALTSIGHDAPAAYDWLTVLRVLKEEIGNILGRDFLPAAALRYWRDLDDVYTYALIEASKIASDMDRANVLEHTESLRREIEQFEQSKSNFIAVAAHELRTPLTILEGYENILRMETEPESRLRLFIDGLENGIQRMKVIVNDLIDISLIDLQSIDLNYQQIDIEKIVNIVGDNLSPHFQKRNVELTIEPFDGLAKSYGDSEKLVKALTKLFLNALKFTPDGGRVTITGQSTILDEITDGIAGFITLRIRDNGIGINPEYLETIFHKFTSTSDVTLHSSSQTNFKGGGPGLGLPIIKGILEAHQGLIWAESAGKDEELCPGSTFHIELPLLAEKPKSTE